MADGDRADLAQRWPNGGVLTGDPERVSISCPTRGNRHDLQNN